MKKKKKIKFPGMVIAHWQYFKCDKPPLKNWYIPYVMLLLRTP